MIILLYSSTRTKKSIYNIFFFFFLFQNSVPEMQRLYLHFQVQTKSPFYLFLKQKL
jgi:hypothetical protein